MNPETETLYAKRLVARLAREPEVALHVQARLSQARERAVASRGSVVPGTTRVTTVIALPWQRLSAAALVALVMLGVAAHVSAPSKVPPAGPRSEQAFIDYHVHAESGLGRLLAD